MNFFPEEKKSIIPYALYSKKKNSSYQIFWAWLIKNIIWMMFTAWIFVQCSFLTKKNFFTFIVKFGHSHHRYSGKHIEFQGYIKCGDISSTIFIDFHLYQMGFNLKIPKKWYNLKILLVLLNLNNRVMTIKREILF